MTARFPLALLLTASIAPIAVAQTPLPRTPLGTPTAVVPPASLTARSDRPASVTLIWPSVVGAKGYRVTRIENTGDNERIIADLAATVPVFEGATCVPGSGTPSCVWIDVTYNPHQLNSQPGYLRYDHLVVSGAVYTYRVRAQFPGAMSQPSQPATVHVR